MKSYGAFLNIITNDRSIIEQRIAFLKQLNNLGHIEVWLEYGEWTLDDSKWLKEKLAGYEIIVHAPFIGFSFVTMNTVINEASLVALQEAVKHVEILEGKVMTVHVGRKPMYITDDEAREMAIPYLERLAEFVDRRFELAIENLPVSTGTSLRYPIKLNELELIIKRVPRLVSTVDIGHCMQNEDDYKEYFEDNIDKILNIHVHNAFTKGRAHFGFDKKGDLDLKEFISFLKKTGYKNYFTLEVLGDDDIVKSWKKLQEIIN
ncbi:MAG: sugar phosphate isomerase/epimerase family protein [Candidatus Kerfeldbacteria bacterium]|jgi:sugar phosphate isomerase/epimerase